MSASSGYVGHPFPITGDPVVYQDDDGNVRPGEIDVSGDHKVASHNYVWDVDSLSWVPETQSGGGSGGTVDQGAPGVLAWPVTVTSGSINVASSAGQPLHVKLDQASAVTGPLTDAELRASPVPVSFAAAAAGFDYHKVAAGSNNADTIKASPGTVYGIKVFNIAAYPIYVKIYDRDTNPTPGVSAVLRTIACQAGLRAEDTIPNGLGCATGIAIAIVKGIADTDNTAVVANDAVVDVDYA